MVGEFQPLHWLLVLAVAALLFGTKRLPDVGRALGRSIAEFKKGMKEGAEEKEDEAGKLAMTHYCAMGNQPHMVLKSGGPAEIRFEMGPTPGINAKKDMHMHSLTLEFPDPNHLIERWTSYQNGKPGETVVLTLTR